MAIRVVPLRRDILTAPPTGRAYADFPVVWLPRSAPVPTTPRLDDSPVRRPEDYHAEAPHMDGEPIQYAGDPFEHAQREGEDHLHRDEKHDRHSPRIYALVREVKKRLCMVGSPREFGEEP